MGKTANAERKASEGTRTSPWLVALQAELAEGKGCGCTPIESGELRVIHGDNSLLGQLHWGTRRVGSDAEAVIRGGEPVTIAWSHGRGRS